MLQRVSIQQRRKIGMHLAYAIAGRMGLSAQRRRHRPVELSEGHQVLP